MHIVVENIERQQESQSLRFGFFSNASFINFFIRLNVILGFTRLRVESLQKILPLLGKLHNSNKEISDFIFLMSYTMSYPISYSTRPLTVFHFIFHDLNRLTDCYNFIFYVDQIILRCCLGSIKLST